MTYKYGVQGHRPLAATLIISTLVLLIVTISFSSFEQIFGSSSSGVLRGISDVYKDINLFENDVADLSDKYALNVTPANWTFAIWIFIYVAQLAWLIYAQTLICRSNYEKTGLLYCSPPFLPKTFFIVYIASLVFNVLWLFVFDREYLVASLVALLGIQFCLHICLTLSFRLLWKYEDQLSSKEMWLNIILVQNGLGLYSGWIAVATLLAFGFVLRYVFDVAMDTTCYVVLSILAFEIAAWAAIDLFMLSCKWTRYYIAPYVVVIVAFTGILQANWDSDSGVQILVASSLGISVVAGALKIVAIVYYRMNIPISIEI